MSVKSVKYLFKYVYKGHDCANIQVTETEEITHNEVSHYLDTRWVSAPEAIWRLSEFEMHAQSHSIIRLPIHLPNQQQVYFQQGDEEAAVDRASHQETMLTAWFKLNQEDDTAVQYRYPDIPMHFVFHKTSKQWKPRKRGQEKIISRMYSVSAADSERFFLRILLLHVNGATSFQMLRTVNGAVSDTFKEACRQHHLLADDTEWNNAMEEASAFQMPRQLRGLFSTIISACEPGDPLQLWNNHKAAMIEDYIRTNIMAVAENLALQDIENVLVQTGKSCAALGLPAPVNVTFNEDIPDIAEEADIGARNMLLLNEEQQIMTNQVLQAVHEVINGAAPACRAFYLDGPGGSGKTMVYNTLVSYLRGNGLKVNIKSFIANINASILLN